VFGIEPELLNDDRLGRALDAIAPHVEQIVGTVGARAISEFGIDVARIHWDMTSISTYGAYEAQDEAFTQVKYGHPKDRRFDLKQVRAGLAVSGDGGIPVFARAYDGGAGEVAQVVGAIQALRGMAQGSRFLLVADSKLVSHGNITALLAAQVGFVAPLPAAKVPDAFYAGLDLAQADAVDYTALRDVGKDPADRGTYRVCEDTYLMAGARKSDPVHRLRRVLVHSSANAAGQQVARAKKLAAARVLLDKLAAGCGTRYYPDPQKVAARLAVITSKHRVGAYLRTAITRNADSTPVQAWYFDQAETAADGWYALVTNLPEDVPAAEVLLRYKGQAGVERRDGEFKGPLAVAPMFLKNNRRIHALLTVITLALLVYCLIERQVRQALGPNQTMRGFYGENRAVRPTGRLILETLTPITLTPATGDQPMVIRISRGIQAQLLELLGIDETRPRWLAT